MCGVEDDIIEIVTFRKLNYCPTHLAIAKKEQAEAKKKEGTAKLDLSELIKRLDDQKVDIAEIKSIFKRVAKRSFLVSEASVLLSILEDPKHHTLRSVLVNKFSAADESDIDATLDRMYKVDEVVDASGTIVGKLLWKNQHGWYIVNPNVPKEAFEQITEEEIDDETFYAFVKTQINRQDRASSRNKDDELFYQYTGVDVATYGDRKEAHLFPVRQEVLDEIKRAEEEIASWSRKTVVTKREKRVESK